MIMMTFTYVAQNVFCIPFSMKNALHSFFIFNFCFVDFPFNEDQDEVPFFYDDSIALGDAPRDWTLPSVSAFHKKVTISCFSQSKSSLAQILEFNCFMFFL